MADINARTRHLIGTAAEWAAHDLVIGDGEIAIERAGVNARFKIGNGAAAWSALPFAQMEPVIPAEYLTQAEGDARFLQLANVTTAAAAGKVPRLGGDGRLAAAMIPLPPPVTVSGGAADAGKLVALAASGRIDPSMITVTTGGYKGVADGTQPVPGGAHLAGDYFLNTGTGAPHPSWGLPGGTVLAPGQQLVFNGTAWDLVGTSTSAYLPLSGGTLAGPGNLRVDGEMSVGGNVGIGTLPSAATRLFVNGGVSTVVGTGDSNANSVKGFFVFDQSTPTAGQGFGWQLSETGAAVLHLTMGADEWHERMRVTPGGAVGVNVTNPQKLMEVFHPQGGLRLSRDFNGGDFAELSFSGRNLSGSAAMIRSYRANLSHFGNEGDLRFYTNTGEAGAASDGAERMVIGESGHVFVGGVQGLGIGGSYLMQVGGSYLAYGDAMGFRAINAAYNGAVGLTVNSGVGGGGTLNAEGGLLAFVAGGAERMRIDVAGNVGIGTAPVSYQRLIASGGIGTMVGAGVNTADSSKGFFAFSADVASPANGFGWQINADGGASLFVYSSVNWFERMRVTAAGVIQDGAGNELGWRDVPRLDFAGGPASRAFRGKVVVATGNVTIDSSAFIGGEVFTLINNTGGNITVTPTGGLNLILPGSGSGARTLVPQGMATVWFAQPTYAWISGMGVS